MNDNVQEQATEESETKAPTTKVIEVTNPTAEEMAVISNEIKVNYDFDVDIRTFKFNFKKTKDKDTDLILDRQSVELPIPVPSVQGVVAILEEGGKQLELLLEAMQGIVTTEARNILSDGPEGLLLNAANFPVDRLSWKAISEIPKVQRRGGGIPKESWDAFAQDYCEVMPEAAGKTPEQVAKAAKLLQGKLAAAKTNKPVLTVLIEQLAIYAEHSPNIEEHSECVAVLLDKADAFLNLSDADLLANL